MTDLVTIRRRRIRKCEETVFDVLVVGGGIVGAGAGCEAQLRGFRALLVEQA